MSSRTLRKLRDFEWHQGKFTHLPSDLYFSWIEHTFRLYCMSWSFIPGLDNSATVYRAGCESSEVCVTSVTCCAQNGTSGLTTKEPKACPKVWHNLGVDNVEFHFNTLDLLVLPNPFPQIRMS